MDKHKFTTEGLTATKWCSPQDKAKFLNDLARFVRSGFKETLFTKSLYTRLSMCFGHIAHYNKYGFYDVWFSTKAHQEGWVKYILSRPIYGDPEWTYSDAERIFQKWLSLGEDFATQTVSYTKELTPEQKKIVREFASEAYSWSWDDTEIYQGALKMVEEIRQMDSHQNEEV